jgi:hypothetical protein
VWTIFEIFHYQREWNASWRQAKRGTYICVSSYAKANTLIAKSGKKRFCIFFWNRQLLWICTQLSVVYTNSKNLSIFCCSTKFPTQLVGQQIRTDFCFSCKRLLTEWIIANVFYNKEIREKLIIRLLICRTEKIQTICTVRYLGTYLVTYHCDVCFHFLFFCYQVGLVADLKGQENMPHVNWTILKAGIQSFYFLHFSITWRVPMAHINCNKKFRIFCCQHLPALIISSGQGCQNFLNTWYHKQEKCTKWTKKVPYGHLSQISLQYYKGP